MAYNLDNWQIQASVRNRPHRILVTEEEQGKVFFPIRLVPVAQHPSITSLGPSAVRDILVKRLYTYLDFTTILEVGLVSPITGTIALRKLGIALPNKMYHDATKILTDEGYHAQQSDSMVSQVERITGVSHAFSDTPVLLLRLEAILEEVSIEYRQLIKLFFAIISETLISSILSSVPRDNSVVSAIREIVADHAADEARHHAFFADVFRFCWPMLSESERTIIGPLLPRLVYAFLEPDFSSVKSWLVDLPLTSNQIEAIIATSYPKEEVVKDIQKAAYPTLQLFKENNVLADTITADAFYDSGLIFNQSEMATA